MSFNSCDTEPIMRYIANIRFYTATTRLSFCSLREVYNTIMISVQFFITRSSH